MEPPQSALGATKLKRRETHSVYGIDALPALVAFPLNPVSIEVREQSIDVVGASGVPVPLLGVVFEESLVLQAVRRLGARGGLRISDWRCVTRQT